ncbi:arginine:agmatine antiporter [Serratia fonticola]|uniref:Arginine/agmatine antiporter n=1 Tax=Serratia fonticola TaxID=47917 RepID=A0A542CV83_SERFO|nr:amino acid permease [Serratia fonticola]TQI78292.1 arginine:agmatine antiporter [Serratia fonticola]TQI94710.1 arginine:agmatine antiporter [Serratia fonticola]TVZ69209.1 arginine:agmatine antiporter [Serratia fonticola]
MGSNRQTTQRMGLTALTIMTASNMMGSGVFMLPSSLAQIGSISVWGWALTFCGVLALALVFAKVSELAPCKGGVIANIGNAFGPFIGLQTTLFYWLSTWIGNCALLVSGVGYLSYFFPTLHQPLHAALACIAILWIFVALGLQGARIVGYAQIFTGTCMLLVVLGIGTLGWFHFDYRLYTHAYNVTGQSNTHAILTAALISLWGFLGLESASVSEAQIINPKRNIPLATICGLGIAALCYVCSSNVIMGILPHQQLIASTSPFADTARLLWGTAAGDCISAMAIIACLGAMPGWQILQTEVPRSAAQAGLFPSMFAATNRHGVAYKGLICTACLMTGVILLTISPHLEQQFRTIIILAISACLIPYAFAAISLPVMMVTQKFRRGRQFAIYSALSLLGLAFVAAALTGAGTQPLFWGIILQMVTIPLYLLFIMRQQASSKFTEGSAISALRSERRLGHEPSAPISAGNTGSRYLIETVYKEQQ